MRLPWPLSTRALNILTAASLSFICFSVVGILVKTINLCSAKLAGSAAVLFRPATRRNFTPPFTGVMMVE